MTPGGGRPESAGRRVVAGYDGSECARHAARWAALEAGHRGAELLLVCGIGGPFTSASGAAPPDRSCAQAQLGRVAQALRAEHPALRISTLLAGSPAATALQDTAGDRAELIVVGSWGAGRASGVPLGSVAFSVASTSRVPVAVVRPEHALPARRPVAVAVDGRSGSDGALDFAFAAADARTVRLLVLHVHHDAIIDGAHPYQLVRGPSPGAGAREFRPPVQIREDRAALGLQLVRWQQRYPQVLVTPVVLFGSPTTTLLDFTRRADLLVVDDARRGLNSAMFLGSTGQALLQLSECPVVVAHSRRWAEPVRG